MPVVLLLAALAILAGVVVVAVGRGGELAMFRPDSLADAEVFTDAADVAAFRPPLAFFGYNAPATDEALHRITRVVAERDAEVAFLRDQIAQLRGTGAAGAWADSGRPDSGRPGSAPQGYGRHDSGRHDSGLHDSGRQGQSEPAGWPDDWTYGGPRGQAEAHGQPGPQADAGWVGGAEAARWAGPEAYAEPERRADPADWPPPAADAGPERVADPGDWPPPAADAGHSNEPEPAAEPLSPIQPEHEPGDTSREAGQP